MLQRVLLWCTVILVVIGSTAEAKIAGSVSKVPAMQSTPVLRVSRAPRPSRRFIRSSVVPSRSASTRLSPTHYSLPTTHSTSSPPRLDSLRDSIVRSHFLLLGEVSPLLAGVRVSLQEEPFDVRKVSIILTADVPSVESVLVYKETGEELGLATRRSSGRYELDLPTGKFILPQRNEVSLYVRARLRPWEDGGESGQSVRVSSIEVRGNGVWSTVSYTKSSTETLPTFVTARGLITLIERLGSKEDVLVSGTRRLLGNFRFTTRVTDGHAQMRLSSLSFQIEQVGGVTLSNVTLRRDGDATSHICSVSGSALTCSALPESTGTIGTTSKLLLYGDVSVPAQAERPSLRLTLNDPGTPSQAGAVTWTDGTSTFTWLPLEQPMVEGTLFLY